MTTRRSAIAILAALVAAPGMALASRPALSVELEAADIAIDEAWNLNMAVMCNGKFAGTLVIGNLSSCRGAVPSEVSGLGHGFAARSRAALSSI